MDNASSPQGRERRWLALGAASSLLNVNEATLRQWADQGSIRAYRTPGGHRRFLRDDIHSLVQSGSRPRPVYDPQSWDDAALSKVRRRIAGQRQWGHEWSVGLDEQGLTRLRFLGRRLLTLAVRAMAGRRRGELREEARLMGEEYGMEVARRGIPLDRVVEGFVYFRKSTMEALRETLKDGATWPDDFTRRWQHALHLSDMVLVSLVSTYEEERKGAERSKALEGSTSMETQ